MGDRFKKHNVSDVARYLVYTALNSNATQKSHLHHPKSLKGLFINKNMHIEITTE